MPVDREDLTVLQKVGRTRDSVDIRNLHRASGDGPVDEHASAAFDNPGRHVVVVLALLQWRARPRPSKTPPQRGMAARSAPRFLGSPASSAHLPPDGGIVTI
jgi:hypothetical protein